jgi:hypothetical protein
VLLITCPVAISCHGWIPDRSAQMAKPRLRCVYTYWRRVNEMENAMPSFRVGVVRAATAAFPFAVAFLAHARPVYQLSQVLEGDYTGFIAQDTSAGARFGAALVMHGDTLSPAIQLDCANQESRHLNLWFHEPSANCPLLRQILGVLL